MKAKTTTMRQSQKWMMLDVVGDDSASAGDDGEGAEKSPDGDGAGDR